MDLHPRLLDALREVSGYRTGTPFWWRRASMAKLAELGLVETWTPAMLAGSKSKTRPYRITPEGRAALARTNAGEG